MGNQGSMAKTGVINDVIMPMSVSDQSNNRVLYSLKSIEVRF